MLLLCIVSTLFAVVVAPTAGAVTSTISAVEAGRFHTCALTTTGGVKCWGYNADGQLGDGSNVISAVPTDVSGLTAGVTAIAADRYPWSHGGHTCALTTSGGVKCWGSGLLGNGTTTSSTTPVDVTGLSGAMQIAVGSGRSCAVLSTGTVKCWGVNYSGWLGDGTQIDRSEPVDVLGLPPDVVDVAVGQSFTCVLTGSGAVSCWGSNDAGQLGNGPPPPHSNNTPTPVADLSSNVIAISAGSSHACALLSDGTVQCWGNGSQGALGNGLSGNSGVDPNNYTPATVPGLTASDIAAGNAHTCAVTTAGAAKCWGYGGNGQIGDGDSDAGYRTSPVDVVGLSSGVTSISAGGLHSCALMTTGGVKCWGWNQFGELGDGTTEPNAFPPVTSPVDVDLTVPEVVPEPPSDVVATGGIDGRAQIQWTSPTTGNPIRSYSITASPGGHTLTVDGSRTSTSMGGLTDETTYTFTVVATNALGNSASSAPSNTATPLPNLSAPVPAQDGIYTLGEQVPIGTEARDASAIFRIEFVQGGGVVCMREFDPYTCDPETYFDTSTIGPHQFIFRVYDTELNTKEYMHTYYVGDPSASDAIDPTIDLTTPAAGATYGVGQLVLADYTCDDAGGSGLTSCQGNIRDGRPIDTSTPGTKTFTVSATDYAGNDVEVTRTYQVGSGSVTETLPPGGGTVTTDPDGLGATEDTPVQISVQSATGGTVSINADPTPDETPPASYTFFGQEVTIEAPDAPDPQQPLILTFSLDASLNPDPSVILVARDGVLLAACNAERSNLPCSEIPSTVDANGDLEITVYTDHASTWNFAVRTAFAFTGFKAPVDNQPTLNSVKAGSAIPVRFSLGGDQGLAVLARGYPVSQKVNGCDPTLPVDAIEQTVNAGTSSLTFASATQQYTYIWKTETKFAGTCRTLTMKLADGSIHRASFKFTK